MSVRLRLASAKSGWTITQHPLHKNMYNISHPTAFLLLNRPTFTINFISLTSGVLQKPTVNSSGIWKFRKYCMSSHVAAYKESSLNLKSLPLIVLDWVLAIFRFKLFRNTYLCILCYGRLWYNFKVSFSFFWKAQYKTDVLLNSSHDLPPLCILQQTFKWVQHLKVDRHVELKV